MTLSLSLPLLAHPHTVRHGGTFQRKSHGYFHGTTFTNEHAARSKLEHGAGSSFFCRVTVIAVLIFRLPRCQCGIYFIRPLCYLCANCCCCGCSCDCLCYLLIGRIVPRGQIIRIHTICPQNKSIVVC